MNDYRVTVKQVPLGIVRRMGEKGEVYIPTQIQTLLGLKPNDVLEILLTDNAVTFKKYDPK